MIEHEQSFVKLLEEITVRLSNREELCEDVVIEFCFLVIKYHPSTIEQGRAAAILSGIIKEGLGKRTKQFLRENHSFSSTARIVLQNAIMRMEGH